MKLSWKRILLAALVVSVFTTLSFMLAGNGTAPPEFQEILLLPLVCIVYGWPAGLIFLLLGVPALYWLKSIGRLSVVWCMVVGATLTALPCLVLQVILHPEQLRLLQMAPFFAVLGIGNGFFTWLILVRPLSLTKFDEVEPGRTRNT